MHVNVCIRSGGCLLIISVVCWFSFLDKEERVFLGTLLCYINYENNFRNPIKIISNPETKDQILEGKEAK